FTDYAGTDPGTKKVFGETVERLKSLGATVVEIALPKVIVDRELLSGMVKSGEFKAQIATYLGTLKPGYPRTLAEMIALSEKFKPGPQGQANPSRWEAFRVEE